jgi:hypothetical protein
MDSRRERLARITTNRDRSSLSSLPLFYCIPGANEAREMNRLVIVLLID